jgi:hypothetical protein
VEYPFARLDLALDPYCGGTREKPWRRLVASESAYEFGPSRLLLAGLASVLLLLPHRLVNDLLRGEFDRIPEDKIANS